MASADEMGNAHLVPLSHYWDGTALVLATPHSSPTVLQLTAEERELAREIETITRKLAPQLLQQPGVGPLAAAQLVLS